MATMVKLLQETDGIVSQTYELQNEAEKQRQIEYEAILKVQAWFRGQRTRAYLRYLNDCAVAIQRRFRGMQGRSHYRIYVKNNVFIMKMNHYNKMAVKIQKVWKGYYTRKYIFNYYSRKRYLEGLVVKNQVIRNELADFAEQQEFIRMRLEEKAAKEHLDKWASKNHHLRSTEVMPGIYNSPFYPFPDEKEYILMNAKPRDHPKEKPAQKLYDPTCKSHLLTGPKPLPPIVKKPQGPFKDPGRVQRQRYKPFQPSLRVATSYTSVEEAREALKREEWVTRLNDNIFVPFTKRHRDYDPLLHTTSEYGHLPYGTKYYREEHLDKHVTQKAFQSVVPPIPVFEKLNDTYSQGQV